MASISPAGIVTMRNLSSRFPKSGAASRRIFAQLRP